MYCSNKCLQSTSLDVLREVLSMELIHIFLPTESHYIPDLVSKRSMRCFKGVGVDSEEEEPCLEAIYFPYVACDIAWTASI